MFFIDGFNVYHIRAQQTRGVEVVFGSFRLKDRLCQNCRTSFRTYEEKQTDVNIAIHLFRLAYLGQFDKAILVTGDSDVIPAVEAVKQVFPAKQIGVVIPIGRRAEHLKQTVDFSFRMKEKHLRTCQLPDAIPLGEGKALKRPGSWR